MTRLLDLMTFTINYCKLLTNLRESSLSLLSGIFPPSWSEATIVAITKPGKDSSDPNNYRPIALISYLCKTMEKMMQNWLMWVFESKDLLASEQCGFRKNRSTADHLVRFDSYIRNAFAKKEHVLAIFFELDSNVCVQPWCDPLWLTGLKTPTN